MLILTLLAACGSDNAIKRANEPPTVAFSAPADGEAFRQGGGLLGVRGEVGDTFDSPPELQVTLVLGDPTAPLAETPLDAAEDGTVATDIDLDTLPIGWLDLRLQVLDTDDDFAEAQVTVDIGGPLGVPDVQITAPDDGTSYALGDTVAFQGSATDTTTSADALVFAWSSDLDGPLEGAISGAGSSALLRADLSEGTHVVTLTATDTDGEIGSDSVTVVIEPEVIIAEEGDLVFSEMMVNPEVVEDEVGEWVELYNTSGHPIDIAGYSFRDDDIDLQVLGGPLLVAAGDYVVLCADMDVAVNGGVPCDGDFVRSWNGGGLALANGPDELVLARPDGVEIDWLHYDDTWYTIGVALGLSPDALDDVVNDDPSYWCDQSSVTAPMTEPGTPGAPNDSCDGM
jgi:hypothetical protein